MIDFKPLTLEQMQLCRQHLSCGGRRGCEYNFTNLYLWGRQKAAFVEGHLVIFSQYSRKSIYLFPVGCSDKKAVLEALMEDAKERGIPCRFGGMTHDDCALVEKLFPGQFRYHFDRDSFDYVYAIDDLAELKGKKYQKKRNHLNRFRQSYPDHSFVPITKDKLAAVAQMVENWYTLRLQEQPHMDFHMERAALKKALRDFEALALEGLALSVNGQIQAIAIGSRLCDDTFDIHFEKALDVNDGTYAAINNGFARYLKDKYPDLRYLNREDDMGLEGLRKAKLSYYPNHMQEKSWAEFLEAPYDD